MPLNNYLRMGLRTGVNSYGGGPSGPNLLADFNFSAPLPSWTTGRTGFSSAFAEHQWEITSAAYAGGYADSGSGTADALVNTGGLTAQTAAVMHNGTAYGTLKAWEAIASTDDLRCSSLATGDFVNEDFCIRLVFQRVKAVGVNTQLAGNYNTKGVLIYWASDTVLRYAVKDTTLVENNLPSAFGDGAPHYLTLFYDHSTTTIYAKSDAFAEVSFSTAGAGGGDFSSSVAYGHGAGGFGVAPAGAQIFFSGLARGANAEQMYTEVFWQHGQEPSGLLTAVSRDCPISVPISATQVGHFGGGATIGSTQLPIAYCDELTSAPDTFGLQCNGVYTNVITYSEALSNWTQSGTSTTTDNQADAPDGFRSASLITAGATNDQITSNTFVTTASWWYGMGIWIKEGSAGCTGRIIFYNETGAAEEGSKVFTATGSWQFIDFSDRATAGGVTMSIKIEIDTSGDSVYVWGAMVAKTGRIQVSPPYLRTSGAAAVSVSSSYRCSTGVVNSKKGEIETIFRMSGAAELDGYLYVAPPTSLADSILLFKSNSAALARVYDDGAVIEDSINAIPTLDTGGIEYVLRHIWDDSAAGDETGGYESVIVRNGVTVLGAASPMEGTRTDTLHGIGLGTNTAGAGENTLIARLRSWDAKAQAIP